MKHDAFSQRVRADLVFRERLPDEAALDPVQWQMPDAVFRLFEAEARRRRTDLNSLIRDFICEALYERAAAIKRIKADQGYQDDVE